MAFVLPESKDIKSRDANGRFIKKGTPAEDTVKTEISTSGPEIIPAKSTGKDSLDEPLISVTVQNPLKKLLHWLDQVRRKQTTTFNFKISIPLIALPIFIVVIGSAFTAFFNLGKLTAQKDMSFKPTPMPILITQAPQPVLISRIGIIKATYQVSPSLLIEGENSSASSSSVTPTQIPSRYVLVTGTTQITFLTSTSNTNFGSYLNQRVLVTGLFDKETNILKINKSSDIEILP